MKYALRISLGLILAVTAGGLFFLDFKLDRTRHNVLSNTQEKQEQNNLIEASLQVDDALYKVSVPVQSSLYDLLKIAKETTQFRFNGKNFAGIGFFVDEINGIKQNSKDGKYWIYYINNKEAQVGVSSYIVQPNDVITWKYEESSD